VNPGTVVKVTYVDVPGGFPNLTHVPNLVGLSVPQAQQALAAKDLQGNFTRQGPNLPLAGTKVISQQTPPGTPVAKGTTIQAVYVEQPLQLGVAVPNLVGLTLAQAQQALGAKDLQGNFVQQGLPIPGQPKKVIHQQTPPGTLVAKGTTITATYTQLPAPPQPVVVPNVVGMNRVQAQAALQAKGLQAQFVGPPGNPLKRRVINQNPSAGAPVAPNATVTMTVVIIP
jgi:serine/threonine-protein kinase